MPTVAIFLCVYNGGEFLEEQIETLAAQTYPSIDVWASDDGSTDRSQSILQQASANWSKGKFRIVKGPARGVAENFRSLIVNKEINADYYAYCDQDDVWNADKLQTAVEWLSGEDSRRPLLFCSRTRILDSAGSDLGLSPLFSRPPAFRNALVQNIAGGNTMVLNSVARDLLGRASTLSGFVAHDWWTYMIVSGAGGSVHYSSLPLVGYRQHRGNLIGENSSWSARWQRMRLMLAGRFMEWNNRNLSALRDCSEVLTDDAQEVVRLFSVARTAGIAQRLALLRRSGVYRQTISGQAGLWAACALSRM